MDPVTLIANTLAAGAAAALKPTAEQFVKDAYAEVKEFIQEKYPDIVLNRLEKRPESQNQRGVLAEDLADVDADKNIELLAKVNELADILEKSDEAAAKAIGVDLAGIKAAYLNLKDVMSEGTGVKIKRAEFKGGIDIVGVRAGSVGLEIGAPSDSQTDSARVQPIKVLFLAANPLDTTPLKLDEEIRAIDQALRQAEFRDHFNIEQHWAVHYNDLHELFLRYQPDIVHFSGHGSKSGEVMLQDNSGNSHRISARALSGLFEILKDNIRCVVLNACYSEEQAQPIARHIDAVVGMNTVIGDPAAINFAAAFYLGLGYGKDVETAFKLGCSRIDLAGLAEQDTPQLLVHNNDPAQIVFAYHTIN